MAVLAGCTGVGNAPTYQEGTVNQTGGEPRTAEQMDAAEALAITEPNPNASPLDSLTLETHEFVVEDGYKGPMVRGVVSNTGSEPVTIAEVRVRVYGTTGAQLGTYMARTSDVESGTNWRFEAILLNSSADIADYDIAVVGVPD